jgi:nucleotide-binding universal stress UspA family protein
VRSDRATQKREVGIRRAARRLVAEFRNRERIMKILIAFDGSIFANVAVDDLRLAGMPQLAEALIVAVVEPDRYAADSFGPVEAVSREWTDRIDAAERSAETIANRLLGYFPRWDVKLETPSGHAAQIILDRASNWPADLIVVGTHGRSGLGRLVLGSVSLKVLREARCSVRVARSSPHFSQGPIRILLGDDGSAEAAAAVKRVCDRSWPADTEVRVLAAPQMPLDVQNFPLSPHSPQASEALAQARYEEEQRLRTVTDESVKRLEAVGLQASAVIRLGSPGDILLEESRSWPADVVFVGARGLGRINRLLLGSVSEALVKQAPCTVEVVR